MQRAPGRGAVLHQRAAAAADVDPAFAREDAHRLPGRDARHIELGHQVFQPRQAFAGLPQALLDALAQQLRKPRVSGHGIGWVQHGHRENLQ